MPSGLPECKAEGSETILPPRLNQRWLEGMSDESVVDSVVEGRKVRTEVLSVSPEVLALNLASPLRRLGAILVDLVVISLLSQLTGPFLGIATGAMLAVLFGNKAAAPLALKFFRWICRGLGLMIVGLSLLVLGHSSFLKSEAINFDALVESSASAAEKQVVRIDPNPTYGQLRLATKEYEKQVDALKTEIEQKRFEQRSWAGRIKSFSGAIGVTFGWSGVYFTLLAGLLNGRTLGKIICRIRAVRINGEAFSFFDGFVRHGGYIAGVAMGTLGFAKILWEPNRQAVQDRIAATVVVEV